MSIAKIHGIVTHYVFMASMRGAHRLAIREGSRTVGAGVVASIVA